MTQGIRGEGDFNFTCFPWGNRTFFPFGPGTSAWWRSANRNRTAGRRGAGGESDRCWWNGKSLSVSLRSEWFLIAGCPAQNGWSSATHSSLAYRNPAERWKRRKRCNLKVVETGWLSNIFFLVSSLCIFIGELIQLSKTSFIRQVWGSCPIA